MRNERFGSSGFTPLWSEDGRSVIRRLMHHELVQMIGAQQVMSHVRNGKRLGVKLVFQPRQHRKYSRQDSLPSSICLTHQDSETNALAQHHPTSRQFGLNTHELADEMIVGNEVDRALSKIEMWPIVGDTKAVRVGI